MSVLATLMRNMFTAAVWSDQTNVSEAKPGMGAVHAGLKSLVTIVSTRKLSPHDSASLAATWQIGAGPILQVSHAILPFLSGMPGLRLRHLVCQSVVKIKHTSIELGNVHAMTTSA